jgi:hypothetical protein
MSLGINNDMLGFQISENDVAIMQVLNSAQDFRSVECIVLSNRRISTSGKLLKFRTLDEIYPVVKLEIIFKSP